VELAVALVAVVLTLEQVRQAHQVKVVLAVMDITAEMNLMVLAAVAAAVLLPLVETLLQTLVALLVQAVRVVRHPYLVHLSPTQVVAVVAHRRVLAHLVIPLVLAGQVEAALVALAV
jgi:hypothetical protein